MKKVLTIIILICITGSNSFSQEKEIPVMYQKDSAVPLKVVPAKKIKSPGLSNPQQKQVKKHKRSAMAQKALIHNNAALTEQQKKEKLAQLKKEKKQKLEVILTPEQKEKIKQKKENKPRRGVTNMPNERTVK